MRTVLRLKSGDALAAFDGRGKEWQAEVVQLSKRGGEILLVDQLRADPANQPQITLALALLKGSAMDNALQKATELGVDRIALVQAGRSNVALKGDRLDRRLSHWRGVIASACEQSGRTWLPELTSPVPLAEVLKTHQSVRTLMLDLNAPTLGTLEAMDSLVCIGPEGGWSEEERAWAMHAGVDRYALASTTLRADTAAAAALVAIQQGWGWPTRA